MQYFNMQPRDSVSVASLQRPASAADLQSQTRSEFRYNNSHTLEDNLKEFLVMKQQQQEIELLAK